MNTSNDTISNDTTSNDTTSNDTISNDITTSVDTIGNKEIPEEMIMKYRNLAVAFINKHQKDLVSIFLQHSREATDEDRIGIIGINLINFNETGKIDVAYLPVRMLEPILATQIHSRIKENDMHIIYFLMSTPYEEQIIEIDIRTLTSTVNQ